MPTLEIVEVPIEDDEVEVVEEEAEVLVVHDDAVATTAPPAAAAAAANTSGKKRKITPPPAETSSSKKKKSKKTKDASKNQLTLGAFFGVKKSSNSGNGKSVSQQASSHDTPLLTKENAASSKNVKSKKKTTKAKATAKQASSSSAAAVAERQTHRKQPQPISPTRKSQLRDIVVGCCHIGSKKTEPEAANTQKTTTTSGASKQPVAAADDDDDNNDNDTKSSPGAVQLLEKFNQDDSASGNAGDNKGDSDSTPMETTTTTTAHDKDDEQGKEPSAADASKTEAKPARSKKKQNDEEKDSVVDLTETTNNKKQDIASGELGLAAGDRIEVQMTVDDDDNAAVPWWGATLLAFDGHYTAAGQAIRVLDYDAQPERGCFQTTTDNVVFVSRDTLSDVAGTQRLPFRVPRAENNHNKDDNDSNKDTKSKETRAAAGNKDDDGEKEETKEAPAAGAATTPPTRVRSKKNNTATTRTNGSSTQKKTSATRTKKKPSATSTTTSSSALPEPLSETAQQWVEKKDAMYQTYTDRALVLLERCRKALPEEQGWTIGLPPKATVDDKDDDGDDVFPDSAVPALAALVEGATQPLSVLAATCTERLNQHYSSSSQKGEDQPSSFVFTTDMVTAKLKVVASRKHYIKHATAVPGSNATSIQTADPFQDECPDHMWRWEVVSVTPEQFAGDAATAVKRARTARKKLATHLNAVIKLLQQLADSVQHVRDSTKLKKAMAKVSQDEERVLKHERDEEKARLATAAKRQKQQQQEQKKALQDEKKQQKLAAAEEKQRQKERAAAEKAAKEEAKAAAERKKQAILHKQQNRMMSFFSVTKKGGGKSTSSTKTSSSNNNKGSKNNANSKSPVPKAAAAASKQTSTKDRDATASSDSSSLLTAAAGPSLASSAKAIDLASQEQDQEQPTRQQQVNEEEDDSFDVQAFRSQIGVSGGASSAAAPKNGLVFCNLSDSARASRRRRTTRVTVPVYVTVVPDDPFCVQRPFSEQRLVEIYNKYKFLSFQEDVRPPYHGTWSKTSRQVRGVTPFGKDTAGHVDYDVDSEAEWEEGDDEVGEDLENDDDAGDDEEEKDDEEAAMMGENNNEDGWLAADDEVDDDLDEETKALRRKQLQGSKSQSQQQLAELTVCIVAPNEGGTPYTFCDDNGQETTALPRVEGYSLEQAQKAMQSYRVETLSDSTVCLDAFAPALVDEASDNSDGGGSSQPRELSEQDKKIFARFVHGCSLGSKDKVVDELRSAHPSVTSSRAQALRMLDSMAEKIKSSNSPGSSASGGRGRVYWRVKAQVLDGLGLSNLALTENQNHTSSDNKDAQQTKEALQLAVAESVHHGLFTSKDKAVEFVRSQHPHVAALSRAECVRLVDAVAEKKKHPQTGVYWQVKEEVRESLGLTHLPTQPPAMENDAAASKEEEGSVKKQTSSSTTPATKKKNASTGSSSSSSKKRKAAPDPPPAASVKLLASFLTKKTKKTDN